MKPSSSPITTRDGGEMKPKGEISPSWVGVGEINEGCEMKGNKSSSPQLPSNI